MHLLSRLPESLPAMSTPVLEETIHALQCRVADMGRMNASDDTLVVETKTFLSALAVALSLPPEQASGKRCRSP